MRPHFARKLGLETLCLCLVVLFQLWSCPVFQAHKELQDVKPDFILDQASGVLLRCAVNSSTHLYPYVATVFTCGCILCVIIAIIAFGGSL